MSKTWDEVVNQFNACPYLFVGSGLTRRYLNLPDWNDLLKHFCTRLSDDEFAYSALKQQGENDFGKMGDILEADFNRRWFNDVGFRTKSELVFNWVRENVSPFKAEVAEYISSFTELSKEFTEEIKVLRKLCEKNVSGIITTNYDTFLETKVASDYKVYVGQEELIFSAIQSIGEIFKIHGSVKSPKSIVITGEDYEKFDRKYAYLAAKLMTVFVEYPIIFIGYSISDDNVKKILAAIVNGLSEAQVERLVDRFVFVKWNNLLGEEIRISEHSKDIGGTTVPMTLVETASFLPIFQALQGKRNGYPVRFLRYMKEALCDYAMTEKPTSNLLVQPYDPNVPDAELVFSIGTRNEYARQGLIGADLEQWYKEIVVDGTIKYSADDVLQWCYPKMIRSQNVLPVFKFLSRATKPFHNVKRVSQYDDLLSKTLINARRGGHGRKSVDEILNDTSLDDDKKAYNFALLHEENVDIDKLENFIKDIFDKYPNVLSTKFKHKSFSTNMRRVIRIYDFLKYKTQIK